MSSSATCADSVAMHILVTGLGLLLTSVLFLFLAARISMALGLIYFAAALASFVLVVLASSKASFSIAVASNVAGILVMSYPFSIAVNSVSMALFNVSTLAKLIGVVFLASGNGIGSQYLSNRVGSSADAALTASASSSSSGIVALILVLSIVVAVVPVVASYSVLAFSLISSNAVLVMWLCIDVSSGSSSCDRSVTLALLLMYLLIYSVVAMSSLIGLIDSIEHRSVGTGSALVGTAVGFIVCAYLVGIPVQSYVFMLKMSLALSGCGTLQVHLIG